MGAGLGPVIGDPRAGLIALGGGAVLLGQRRHRALRVVGIALVAFGATGASAAAASHQGATLSALTRDVPRCDFAGRVLEQAGGLGTLASIDRLVCSGRPEAGGVVMIEDAERLPSGALLSGTAWLLPLALDSFGEARRRLGARAVLDPIDLTTAPPTAMTLRVAAGLRGGLIEAARTTSEREGALLVGLTVGDTSGFDQQTIDSFRRTGLSHLLAVSGSNVAMVLACVALLARRASYRLRLLLGFGLLALFVLIVGPDPSVLRAALMGAVSLLALGWARRVDPLHSLGLALLVILTARPPMVGSVGLHLSAAATLGIVLWARELARYMSFLPQLLALPLGLTLAAQIGVAPILVATFGEISLVAPITNLLVGPAVWLATLSGLTVAIVAPISSVAAAGLVRLVTPALHWILGVADRGSALPWASAGVAPIWGWPLGCVALVLVFHTLRHRSPGAS